MPSKALAPRKAQFALRDGAERDFDDLGPEIRHAFLDSFPEFARHPWRATSTLDVGPLRDLPGRRRLKFEGGPQGVYRALADRSDFERFETRDAVYGRLRRYVRSRT